MAQKLLEFVALDGGIDRHRKRIFVGGRVVTGLPAQQDPLINVRIIQTIELLIQYTITIGINNVIWHTLFGRDFHITQLTIDADLFHDAVFPVNDFDFRFRQLIGRFFG
jgi:hypothetical protein